LSDSLLLDQVLIEIYAKVIDVIVALGPSVNIVQEGVDEVLLEIKADNVRDSKVLEHLGYLQTLRDSHHDYLNV